MMPLIEATAKISAIIALALVAAALLRRRSAATRHWILAAAIVCSATMPALTLVAPRWQLRFGPVAAVPHAARAFTGATSVSVDAVAAKQPAVRMSEAGTVPTRMLAAAWLAGTVIGLALLLGACARLAWMASRSTPIVAGTWFEATAAIAATLGLRRPVVLLQSTHPSLLVTWGVLRPKVILPAGALEWPEERVRVVLVHELAHVRRADWMLQILGCVLRAVYWFNPLIWLACLRLRHESERACDDDVLNSGVTGSEYATHLLEVARLLHRRAWFPAPGMARPSSLQRRVRAMLNTNVNRHPVSMSLRLLIAAVALGIAVTIAGSGVAAQSAGTALSGSFVDALNNAIPNVTLTVTNNQTGEAFAVRSDADGRFSFESLPAGEYRGAAEAAGFSEVHSFFRVGQGRPAGDTVIPLPLGHIEESVTVSTERASETVVTATAYRIQAFRQRTQGSTLVPPLKIRDVRPMYPPNRTDDTATVFLTGIIDVNGFMKGLQVLEPADPEFARAASDAVNNWQFESTRLHGVPVDTWMHVTVRFVH